MVSIKKISIWFPKFILCPELSKSKVAFLCVLQHLVPLAIALGLEILSIYAKTVAHTD